MGSRQNLRTSCDSPCTLNYEGINYSAMLENISLGGALVKVDGDILYRLHIGDSCSLMLCNNPDLCPTKYSCKIMRLYSSEIGVNFQKPKG